MKYQVICPGCGAKLWRRHFYSTLTLDYRCRQCGSRFRLTGRGWAAGILVVVLEAAGLPLVQYGWLSRQAGMTVALTVCIFGLWFLPYFTPVRPSPAAARKDEPTAP